MVKVVRLYGKDDEGRLYDMKDEYDLSELCNTVPEVGDQIVSPWVDASQDRRDFRNRQVYEITARYFLPRGHGDDVCYVALLVNKRPGQELEADLVTVS